MLIRPMNWTGTCGDCYQRYWQGPFYDKYNSLCFTCVEDFGKEETKKVGKMKKDVLAVGTRVHALYEFERLPFEWHVDKVSEVRDDASITYGLTGVPIDKKDGFWDFITLSNVDSRKVIKYVTPENAKYKIGTRVTAPPLALGAQSDPHVILAIDKGRYRGHYVVVNEKDSHKALDDIAHYHFVSEGNIKLFPSEESSCVKPELGLWAATVAVAQENVPCPSSAPCECGSSKLNLPRHSSWCPKYNKV